MGRLLPSSLLLALLAGCATGDGMQSKLQDASQGYNRYVRWGDLDRAAEFLPRASRNAFMSQHEEVADDLVIVEYDVTRLALNKERGTATSRAVITWHTDRRLILEETRIEQVWQWHGGDWILVDERRVGGTPLALYADRELEAHPYLPGLESYRKRNAIGEENKPGRKGKRADKKHEPQAAKPRAATARLGEPQP